MPFKFTQLPTEVALEIIRLAAIPALQDDSLGSAACSRPYYATALCLASVSYTLRAATMPYLLRTVILHSKGDHAAFIHSIHQQQDFAENGSRLALDYAKLVRRLWSSGGWGPVMNEPLQSWVDYSALRPIICAADSVGLTWDSLNILDGQFQSLESRRLQEGRGRRVTFAGNNPRWNPLTSTEDGLNFLRQITHLTIWADESANEGDIVPSWVHRIPFACMPNLTHFACPPASYQGGSQSLASVPTEVIVYAASCEARGPHPLAVPGRGHSLDLATHGTKVSLELPTGSDQSENLIWESIYLQGADDDAWAKAEHKRGLKDDGSKMRVA